MGLAAVAALLLWAAPAALAQTTFSASGASPGDIQPQVDALRASLGTLNANVAGSFGTGRREINWDGVPDGFASPNAFPADFFNGAVPGRARGALFSTPGTGFEVSARVGNPTGTTVEFGNLDPSYPGTFQTFSPERLFTAVASNITDVTFFVPGSTVAAAVMGFGAVFTDVDDSASTTLQYYDKNGNLLYTLAVPAGTVPSESLSFAGATFASPIVARVRITSGSVGPGPGVTDSVGADVAVMDDFIYGEPISAAVPEPSALALLLPGLPVLGLLRRRRR